MRRRRHLLRRCSRLPARPMDCRTGRMSGTSTSRACPAERLGHTRKYPAFPSAHYGHAAHECLRRRRRLLMCAPESRIYVEWDRSRPHHRRARDNALWSRSVTCSRLPGTIPPLRGSTVARVRLLVGPVYGSSASSVIARHDGSLSGGERHLRSLSGGSGIADTRWRKRNCGHPTNYCGSLLVAGTIPLRDAVTPR